MSFDGTVLHGVVFELNEKLQNGRIDKIYQHENNDLIINIRNHRNRYQLLLSASGNNPRVYITNDNRENPTTPPTFCMLLRKHLENTKILFFEQFKMDRIMKMVVSSRDELGDEVEKALVIEIMGKHSNIILINNESKIIYDSIKRVNRHMSRIREILPGKEYSLTGISDKKNPLMIDSLKDYIIDTQRLEYSIKRFLMDQFTGISPQMVREICYRSYIDPKTIITKLSEDEMERLNNSFTTIFKQVKKNQLDPIKIFNHGELKDFYSIDLLQYDEKEHITGLSNALDCFYIEKDLSDRLKNKSHNIKRFVKNELDKAKRKLSHQIDEYNEALDREKYKIYGDLISSNFHKIKKGASTIRVENFYDHMNEISIPLDITLDAPQNANRYYKKYSKLKNAAKRLKVLIDHTTSDIDYLKEVELSLDLAENNSDIEEIRKDLESSGFLREKKKRKKKETKIQLRSYQTEDGFVIYVGRNNRQNDFLTMKFASREDLWFHVKDAPGSHVILKNDGREFSTEAINAAGALAAKYSSLSSSTNVEVDYTIKKNIKRHPAKRAGLVIYEDFNTLSINQKDHFLDSVIKIDK
ncbi:MAG: NFACT RNA binding domain-containing protein [Tissierellia bacterium]|nr:NFACT RNA binding domain-containing protein [Tissierellia bacterium]